MKKILITAAAVLVGVGFLLLCFYMYVQGVINSPCDAKNYPVKVTIDKGMTTAAITDLLYEAGLIKSKLFFRYEVGREDAAGKLQAGWFKFEEPMNMPDLINILLTEGRIPPQKYTFLEGLTISQYADALVKREEIDAHSYENFANFGRSQFEFKFNENIPAEAGFEGFLFPETYLVEEPDAQKLVQVQLTMFEKTFNDTYVERCKELGLTIYEAITFASIVEVESGVTSEMPLVASVFWNRLENNWTLDSNSTLAYGLGIDGYVLTHAQTRMDHPFNTYKNAGLPPGPICNPGRAAIRATLWPEETEYFFFVAKGDGTSVFSKTYAEHQENVRKYLP